MFVVTVNAIVTLIYVSLFFLINKKSRKNLVALGYLSSLIELNAIYQLADFNDPTSSWIGSLLILSVLFVQLLVTIFVILIAREKG